MFHIIFFTRVQAVTALRGVGHAEKAEPGQIFLEVGVPSIGHEEAVCCKEKMQLCIHAMLTLPGAEELRACTS
jgi:hypothetical protein